MEGPHWVFVVCLRQAFQDQITVPTWRKMPENNTHSNSYGDNDYHVDGVCGNKSEPSIDHEI